MKGSRGKTWGLPQFLGEYRGKVPSFPLWSLHLWLLSVLFSQHIFLKITPGLAGVPWRSPEAPLWCKVFLQIRQPSCHTNNSVKARMMSMHQTSGPRTSPNFKATAKAQPVKLRFDTVHTILCLEVSHHCDTVTTVS